MSQLGIETFEGVTIGQPIDETMVRFSNVDNHDVLGVAGLVGSKGMVIDTTGTAAVRDSGSTWADIDNTDLVFRWAFKYTNAPAVSMMFAHIYEGDLLTGTKLADLMVTNDNHLLLRVYGPFSSIQSTTTFTPGSTYAVEWRNDTTGNLSSIRIFNTTALVAAPVDSFSLALPSGASIGQFQLGKMTSGTWTGGCIFDQYILADDWVAVVVGQKFNLNFPGTPGNPVTLGDGLAVINGTAPVFAVGGPQVDQSVMLFATQGTGARSVRPTQFTATEDNNCTYRIYTEVLSRPANASQRMAIAWWTDTSDQISFMLTVAKGPGTKYVFELWAGLDWLNPSVSPAQSKSAGINPGDYVRLDCHFLHPGSTLTAQIDIYPGRKQNASKNPSASLTGTSTVGAARRMYVGQLLATEPGTHVGVAFDAWVGAPTGAAAPGPLDPADQFNPLNTQWQFSEWVDTNSDGIADTERPLGLQGVWDGTTVQPLNIGTTDVTEGGASGGVRFYSDPGPGKAYLGGNRADGEGTEQQCFDWYGARMHDKVTQVGGARNRPQRLIRSEIASTAGDAAAGDTHPFGGSTTWPASCPPRTSNIKFPTRLIYHAHGNNAIPWVELDVRHGIMSGGGGNYEDALAAAYDQIVIDKRVVPANMTGSALTAYNWTKAALAELDQFGDDPIWFSMNHEEDGGVTVPQTNYRKAQRAFVLIARSLGYFNLVFVAICYITQTWNQATGMPNPPATTYDWRGVYPDWKGTSKNGATAYAAFPNGSLADFYTVDSKIGAWNESVVDIIGHDVYFWDLGHGEWQASTSVSNADAFPAREAFLGWEADHNRAWARAGGLGKPFAFGETGTQAAGYLDGSGNLIQRSDDIEAMRSMGLELGPHIQAGEIVGISYFNKSEHKWGTIDNNYSKALPWAEMFDRFDADPGIS